MYVSKAAALMKSFNEYFVSNQKQLTLYSLGSCRGDTQFVVVRQDTLSHGGGEEWQARGLYKSLDRLFRSGVSSTLITSNLLIAPNTLCFLKIINRTSSWKNQTWTEAFSVNSQDQNIFFLMFSDAVIAVQKDF